VLIAELLAQSGLFAQTSAAPSEAPKSRVVLVELFTSEGCSSCPPADKLLKQIDQKQVNAGQLIVGISEHVTYWNSLGWADPFSAPEYTARQEAYGNHFGLDSVYTPQMVVNGAEQFVGSDSASLLKALHQEQGQTGGVAVRIQSLSVASNQVVVHYLIEGKLPSAGFDLLAVLADDMDKSSVERGENSGKTLNHVAVARTLSRVAHVKTSGEATVNVPLPKSFHPSQAHHLILFAQTNGYGRILDADSKAL
jgi:hypothetical protein